VSVGNHAIQDLMVGRAILQASLPLVKYEPADILQLDPERTRTWLGTVDVVVPARSQFTSIGDVKLKVMNCVGCTGTALTESTGTAFTGSIVVKGAANTAVTAKLHWNLENHVFAKGAWRGNATPINISDKQSAFEICHDLLLARRGLLTVEQVAALDRQLKSILADEEDNFELSGISVSPTSLDGLIKFLARHRPASHPNIALTREGHFTASWLGGKRAKVTLIFDQEGGDWIGVDLESRPAVRCAGAFVVNSLAGIAQPFRSWIKA
jgi:hypothetical protein